MLQETIKYWLLNENNIPLTILANESGINLRILREYKDTEEEKNILNTAEKMIYASGRAILLPKYSDLLMIEKYNKKVYNQYTKEFGEIFKSIPYKNITKEKLDKINYYITSLIEMEGEQQWII